MKKTRKIIAMALAIVMLLSLMAGCAKEPVLIASDPTEGHTHTEAPTEEATEAPTEAEEEVQYASVVFLTVNPKFAIYFDGDYKVVMATAENKDGKDLNLDLELLNGMNPKMAVEAMLNAVAAAGYFEDGKHDIHLTFYGEKEGDLEDVSVLKALEKEIYEAAEAYVANKGIKVKVKVKTSPEAAPVKKDELDKLPAPPAPDKKPDKEEETTQPTEAPKPTEPAVKPTEAPKPTTPPATQPTTQPTVPAHQHEYKTEVVKATYETGGYTKYTCSCGHSYEGNQTAPLPKPTEPSEGTSGETEPTTPSDAKCPKCGGPHYLLQCPVAKEDAEKEQEPDPCYYCGSTNCEYPKTGDVTKCKGYDEKKDGSKYCQTCGKPVSECTSWTADMNCPKCGAFVPKFACHSC